MKMRLHSITFILGLLIHFCTFAQDFSNKGKEFWLAYSYHVGMVNSDAPTMTLYITSDVNTGFKVEIEEQGDERAGILAAARGRREDLGDGQSFFAPSWNWASSARV